MDYAANSKLAEEEYDEYTEIILPKNKITNSFITYSEEDKLKIIELGISVMNSANKKLNAFNNRDWAEKLSSLEIEKETIITNLRQTNEELEERYRETINIHKRDIKRLREKIRDEANGMFQNEIERLKQQKEVLNQKLESFNTQLLEQQRENFQSSNKRISELRKEYESKSTKMQEEFTKALERQTQMVSNLQDHSNKQKQNSTIKGQSGEEWVRNELLRQCPTIEIIDTHKEKEKGDFILRESDMEGMLESKAYKKNVPKKEIDKFYRDMDKNQYNYGIFAALDHGVVRRPDFHLEFRNGCPIVFLHEVRENPKKLSLAIDFCKLIEKNKSCIDITNEETIIKIKNLIKPMNAEYNCQKQLLSKFQDNMEKSIQTQFENIKGVLGLLNIDSI